MISVTRVAWYKDFTLYKGIYLLSILYLVWAFLAHGVQALFVAEKYIPIAQVLLPASLAKAGLVAIGIIDIAVAALLVSTGWKLVIAYAGLYPFVPMILQYFATGELELIGKIVTLGCAALALFLQYKKKIV